MNYCGNIFVEVFTTDITVLINSLAQSGEKTDGDMLEPERKDQLIRDQRRMFQKFIVGQVLNDDDKLGKGRRVREYALNRREPDCKRSKPFLRTPFQKICNRSLFGVK